MHDSILIPRRNPAKQIPIVMFYLGTLAVATILIAAPALYIYNSLKPPGPASIRSSIVRATDPVAPPHITKGHPSELDNNNRLMARSPDKNCNRAHDRREPVHGTMYCLNTLLNFILRHPLLCLYLGLASGIIYILICAVDCKFSYWRDYDNKF